MQRFLEAVAEAVEEASINSLFAGDDMTGINGTFVPGFPLDDALDILRQYGRLNGAGNV